MEPHPEWVAPRGTTLLESRIERNGSELGSWDSVLEGFPQPSGSVWDYPGGEWTKRRGNLFLPYAAGIPGKLRVVYDPCFALFCHTAPTILKLESGIQYHAYYWEPMLGIKFDLGTVKRPAPGTVLLDEKFENAESSRWTYFGKKSQRRGGRMSAHGSSLAVANDVNEKDLVAGVDGHSDTNAELVFRHHDEDNYIAAVYSRTAKAIYVLDRSKGNDGNPLGSMPVASIGPNVRLSAEVRGGWAVVSITDGSNTYSSMIVAVSNTTAGGAGLKHEDDGATQSFGNFELRKSPALVTDEHPETKLYDAKGGYRGELKGPGWDDYGKEKVILLDAYLPHSLPMPQDWVLVLENLN
jgi:hypothetical protein